MDRITKFSKSQLLKRVVTAVTLLPAVLLIIYLGKITFLIAMLSIAVLMAYEWNHITGEKMKWKLAGTAYIAIPIAALIYIRSSDHGFSLILFLLLTIWATDIGAYFSGIFFGGPKIAPSVSPSKTWSGSMGGLVCALLVGIAFEIIDHKLAFNFVRVAFFISILAQVGDLFESFIKRYFNVKDSGSILPGHGGFLDRMDSMTFAAPFFAILV